MSFAVGVCDELEEPQKWFVFMARLHTRCTQVVVSLTARIVVCLDLLRHTHSHTHDFSEVTLLSEQASRPVSLFTPLHKPRGHPLIKSDIPAVLLESGTPHWRTPHHLLRGTTLSDLLSLICRLNQPWQNARALVDKNAVLSLVNWVRNNYAVNFHVFKQTRFRYQTP